MVDKDDGTCSGEGSGQRCGQVSKSHEKDSPQLRREKEDTVKNVNKCCRVGARWALGRDCKVRREGKGKEDYTLVWQRCYWCCVG